MVDINRDKISAIIEFLKKNGWKQDEIKCFILLSDWESCVKYGYSITKLQWDNTFVNEIDDMFYRESSFADALDNAGVTTDPLLSLSKTDKKVVQDLYKKWSTVDRSLLRKAVENSYPYYDAFFWTNKNKPTFVFISSLMKNNTVNVRERYRICSDCLISNQCKVTSQRGDSISKFAEAIANSNVQFWRNPVFVYNLKRGVNLVGKLHLPDQLCHECKFTKEHGYDYQSSAK